MGLFTDIYNTVAKFFRQQDEAVIGEESKSVATNRLKLVLMQDRTNLTPRVLEQMRGELVDLLSKYLEMDKELLELNFEQEGDQVALMLSIPVIRAKDEDEIEEALNKANSEESFEEEVSEETESKEESCEDTECSSAEECSEEEPKPKKKRSKKVSTPEGLEGNSEEHHEEENICENTEV
ncbi:cell division topological specificity factor MinE [bacterium]|nr:cell division topological specificity factor MinE [bacterium]